MPPAAESCTRCESLRQQLIVARVLVPGTVLWTCPECSTVWLPVTLSWDRSSAPDQTQDLAVRPPNVPPARCPCIAGGPLVLARAGSTWLWLCHACGNGLLSAPLA